MSQTVRSLPRLTIVPRALALTIVGVGLALATAASADDPKARAIMERVDARDDGDNQTSRLQMVLMDKRDKQLVR